MAVQQKKIMPYLCILLAMILLILGWIGYSAVDKMAGLTNDLYHHPYTVSTAVLRINANVTSMHRDMKDLALATTPEEVNKYRMMLEQKDQEVLTDFQLVGNRFLGEPKLVQEAFRAFLSWKPLWEEVTSLSLQGKRQEAIAISQGTGARQVEEVEMKVNALLAFSKNKAQEFYSNAQEVRTKTLLLVLISFGIAVMLVVIISYKAVYLETAWQEINQNLEMKVQERTMDLVAANEELIARDEDVRVMNSELTRMNEKLEVRVEERTAELTAANQELRAIEEQLREQFHHLWETQDVLQQSEDKLKRLNDTLEQCVAQRTMQLEATNKELEGFSYSVSHDLRAPLRHIIGFIELLNNRVTDAVDEKSRHYLEVIAASATKMGNLIDDLLAFSRMGKGDMLQGRVNMNNLIKEAIDTLQPEAKNRNIQWTLGELPDVHGDRSMLSIAVTNLIGNALKYTRPKSEVKIEIGVQADMTNSKNIVYFIKDNGIGFDMQYQDKLFQVFQRLHHQHEFEGTGIGLANVQRIILRHGGRIWAESMVNHGAAFYFTIGKHMEENR